jgi:hypothetical protein
LGKPELLNGYQELLVLFRAHQPYHGAVNPNPTNSPAAGLSEPFSR